MANSKRTLFLKRRLRVRNKLRKINTGKPRLSVHRSSKNISVEESEFLELTSAEDRANNLSKVLGKNNIGSVHGKMALCARKRSRCCQKCYFDRGGRLFHGK